MTEHKNPIYKIKFEVEIEITKEITKTRRGIDKAGYTPEIHIAKDVLINGYDTANDVDKIVSDRCAYIEEHHPEQIKDSFAMMFYLEGPAIAAPFDDVRSKARKNAFDATKAMVDQRQRQRLPIRKGRNPHKSKKDYLADKEKFVNKSVEMLRTLKNEGVAAPTLTDLAEKMFETYIDRNNDEQYYAYPLKELGKKLDLYKISFEDLAKKSTNNVR